MIHVAIADDHAIVRAGLRALIGCEPDMTLVAEAADGREALEIGRRSAIDVFLVDLSLPSIDGVEVISRLRTIAPRTRVLVLFMHAMPEYVRPALRAGAHGYVVKGTGLDDLIVAIRAVHAGGRFLDAAASAALETDVLDGPRAEAPTDDLDLLTAREREVLRMIAQGHTNRSIAGHLGLSPKTIDAHRTNLMRKLGLHDIQGLTRFAVRRGLVEA